MANKNKKPKPGKAKNKAIKKPKEEIKPDPIPEPVKKKKRKKYISKKKRAILELQAIARADAKKEKQLLKQLGYNKQGRDTIRKGLSDYCRIRKCKYEGRGAYFKLLGKVWNELKNRKIDLNSDIFDLQQFLKSYLGGKELRDLKSDLLNLQIEFQQFDWWAFDAARSGLITSLYLQPEDVVIIDGLVMGERAMIDHQIGIGKDREYDNWWRKMRTIFDKTIKSPDRFIQIVFDSEQSMVSGDHLKIIFNYDADNDPMTGEQLILKKFLDRCKHLGLSEKIIDLPEREERPEPPQKKESEKPEEKKIDWTEVESRKAIAVSKMEQYKQLLKEKIIDFEQYEKLMKGI